MIFKDELCAKVLNGEKTQTRRIKKENERLIPGDQYFPDAVMRYSEHPSDPRYEVVKWQVGRTYAVQPGRGKKAVGRIKLLAIREERLQEINGADAIAEGWPRDREFFPQMNTAIKALIWFRSLWNSINKKPGTRWVDNPWVWVLEFRRLGGEE